MNEFVAFFRSIWGLWLMGLFVVIIAWAFWPRNRKKFSDAAEIPLRDDEGQPPSGDKKS
jgi:cytochrome c oxidase cbb3-type subunit IV